MPNFSLDRKFEFPTFYSKQLTQGSWLLRISVVRFSLVCIFKKIVQIFSLCNFHYIREGIPSLMRFWLLMTSCCGFGSCGFSPDLKKCTSQGPGVLFKFSAHGSDLVPIFGNGAKVKIPSEIKLPLQRRRRRRLTSSRVRKKNHFAIYGQEKISFFKRELLPLASRASNVYFFVHPHIVVIAKHERILLCNTYLLTYLHISKLHIGQFNSLKKNIEMIYYNNTLI